MRTHKGVVKSDEIWQCQSKMAEKEQTDLMVVCLPAKKDRKNLYKSWLS